METGLGILTIIPPIIAIVIAIAFKKVALALLIGVFSGQLLLSGWSPFAAVTATLDAVIGVCTDADNLKIFFFTALMGSFVTLVKVSGGVDGFVDFLTEKNKAVRSKTGAMLIAYLIGILVFVDGLLSIMFAGVVTRPITDKFKVSREKLAYIADSTSAPINALIPLNSWGAMLIGLVSAEIAGGVISGDATSLFISSLPFQFYSIAAVLLVLFFIVTKKDFGPMKKAEQRTEGGQLFDKDAAPLLQDAKSESIVPRDKANKWNMIVPLVTLIAGTFVGLLVTGGGNLTGGDGTTSILYAIIVTLLVMLVMYTRQKLMSAKDFGGYVMQGVAGMISLVTLLVLAFAIGRTIKAIGTGLFLASLVGDAIPGAFGPAIIFLLGAVMAFSTGTSWGTFSIMMPIAIPMAVAMGSNIPLAIGAVVSGGIFGDHCSPMSDTTILSSMSAGTDHICHVRTQLPYALLAAAIATVLYVIFGLVL